jgi:imidazolonepropionase-like amidohydrolase
MLADLVVIEGDPLADVRVLTQPERVWLVLKEGRPVAGRALAGELQRESTEDRRDEP